MRQKKRGSVPLLLPMKFDDMVPQRKQSPEKGQAKGKGEKKIHKSWLCYEVKVGEMKVKYSHDEMNVVESGKLK